MSELKNFIFGAGGVQVGDYLTTERTEELLKAKGQDINGFGFTELEPIVELTESIEQISTFPNVALGRAFCIDSNEGRGWRGQDGSNKIDELDFITGVLTQVDSGGNATNGYYDACCTEAGDRIFQLGVATSINRMACRFSLDEGVTWQDTILFVGGFTGMVSPSATIANQLGLIQCDRSGVSLRVVMTATDTNFTVVFESTDEGSTWNEILTPRLALSNAKTTSNSAISRDLSTVVITSDTQLYISVGGTGTLTDVAANLPVAMSADLRASVSDDGSIVSIFDISASLTDKITFHTTSDDGVNWLTQNFELNIPPETESATIVKSMYFDPNDKNVLFVLVSASGFEGAIYKVNIDEFSVEKVDEILVNSNTINPNLVHIQSDFKSNNTGFVYGINDPLTRDKTYRIDISSGKLLLNTTQDSQPLKIFAGKQTEGLGFDWNRLVSPTSNDIRKTYISSDKTDVIVCGFNSAIFFSNDSGATFADASPGGFTGSTTIFSIDGSDNASVLIAVGVGQIRFSTDQGANWTASAGFSRTGSGAVDSYQACSCIADGSTVIAAVRNGELDVSTDSAVNFTLLATPFSAAVNKVLRSASIARGNDQLIFVGNEGGKVKRSINGGTSFVDPSTPPVVVATNSRVYDIDCSSDGARVITAIEDQLFLSTDTGDTWIEIAIGFTRSVYREVTMSNDGLTVFVTNDDGGLFRSFDGGVTFLKTEVEWEETRRKAKGIKLSFDGVLAYCGTDDGLLYRTV